MKFGRLEGDRIAETFAAMPVLAPELMQHVQEVPDEVEPNWTFDGALYAPPPSEVPVVTAPLPFPAVVTARRLARVLVQKGFLQIADLIPASSDAAEDSDG